MATATLGALIVRPQPVPIIRSRPTVEVETVVTVADLCEQFLFSKRIKMQGGELTERSLVRLLDMCKHVKQFFGQRTALEDLRPMDFTRYRASLAVTRGPCALGTEVQNARSLFKYAYETDLLDRPMRFGPDFVKPNLRLYRRVRRSRGLQMFEAEEIRTMLNNTRQAMQAMIFLGVNCGFGNADCGRLPFSALNLKTGWVDFPRPKTETDRRCPLWPETIQAIERFLLIRPKATKPEFADRVFLTRDGNPWANGEESSHTTKQFRRLMNKVGIRRKQLNFYGFRRTFETIGGESLDQPAVDLIMGHVPRSTDMAAVYRQRIGDDRLQAVVKKVREWLFPGCPSDHFDPHHHNRAADVAAEWDQLQTLSAAEVARAMELLNVSQRELGRGTGLNSQWLNTVICSRRPMGTDTELKIRLYVQQMAEGKTPKPVLPEQIRPVYNTPADVPLTDEARQALASQPLTGDAVSVLTDCLASMGITQVTLAQWWGLKYRYYKEMRYGQKPIPGRAADRLRVLFGLPSALPAEMPAPIEPGKIPCPPEIATLLNCEPFQSAELKAVLRYLRRECGVWMPVVAGWLGITKHRLEGMQRGRQAVTVRSALRSLFALPAIGGAT